MKKIINPKNKAEFWDSLEYPLFIFPPKSLFFILKMATLSIENKSAFSKFMNPKTRRNFGILQSIHFSFFRQKVCFLSWKWPSYQSKTDNHFEALWTQKQGGILGFFRVSTFHFCAKRFVFYSENGHLINRKLIIILKVYGPKNKAEFWDSSAYPLFIFEPKMMFFILKMATLSIENNVKKRPFCSKLLHSNIVSTWSL